MNDLDSRLRQAGQSLEFPWDGRGPGQSLETFHRRQRRRRRVKTMQAAALATVMIAGGGLLWLRGRTTAAPPAVPVVAVSSPTTLPVLTLRDGSRVTSLQRDSDIQLVADNAEATLIKLRSGRGRFNVMPRGPRKFTVSAGDVTVSVVGTVFTVERIADRVGVVVERGQVNVSWPSGRRSLTDGDEGWFPPIGEVSAEPTAPVAFGAGAHATPIREPPQPSAAELMSTADKALRDGNPARAAELLRRLLRYHGHDSSASLAAFTLGRILLFDLRDYRGAAEAFAQARALAPAGAFADDALAREV
jgi:transmembrane sensor